MNKKQALNDISQQRLCNQLLIGSSFKTPKEAVAGMGALQAQDYSMAKWAIGIRLPEFTDELVENALTTGEIIRTHVLRPTWHIVSSDDVRWMIRLTAPHIKRAAASMERQLGLDESTFQKSNAIIAGLLDKEQELSRKEIARELEKRGIAMNNLRAMLLLFRAELDMIVCNGPRRGKELTYALFDKRVPAGKSFERDEALAELAHRYFSSHGPATTKDFAWWSGLPTSDAKKGTELAATKLVSKQLNNETFWLAETSPANRAAGQTFHLLPAFDEFLVGYKDRSASLPADHNRKTITVNGIFKPVIVRNGHVLGTWKRSAKKDTILVEPSFFHIDKQLTEEELRQALEGYGQFLGMNTRIEWNKV